MSKEQNIFFNELQEHLDNIPEKEPRNEKADMKKYTKKFVGPTFIQIPDKELKDRIADMSPYSLKLWLYLSADAFEGQKKNRFLGICAKSLTELEKTLKISRKTLIKSIDELHEKEYIKTTQQEGSRTTVFAINPYRSWKGKIGEEWKSVYMKSVSGGTMVEANITIKGEFK